MKSNKKSNLNDFPLYLFYQGKNNEAYKFFGVHPVKKGRGQAHRFRVWAPRALSVSVVGDFNNWDRTVNPMELISDGVWETTVSKLKQYDSYKYNRKKGIKCNKEIVSAMADAFCNILVHYGYYAGIYTNIDYYNNFFNDTVKNKYGLWIAQWSTKCKIENFDIWQYGAEQNLIDSKYIDGISGIVDKNITYKNFPLIMETTGLNHIVKKFDKMDIDKNGVVDSYDALKILEKVVNSND